jgi:hypothetical protein
MNFTTLFFATTTKLALETCSGGWKSSEHDSVPTWSFTSVTHLYETAKAAFEPKLLNSTSAVNRLAQAIFGNVACASQYYRAGKQ